MARDKQKLLEIHRRHKRYLLSLGILLALASAWLHWVLPVLVGILLWVAHEAWRSDHLFYSPQADYAYDFGGAGSFAVEVGDTLSVRNGIPDGSTLILEVTVCATVTGRFVDPHILLGNERFDFERGVSGRRFLDISQHREALAQGGSLSFSARHCRLAKHGRLSAFDWPDFAQRRVMVLAPHADDAELAAFGLYSRCADPCVVTLTQGEAEAEAVAASLDIPLPDAARLKGRLRSWDSVAIPRWGNVPAEQCLQLGYFCMQLAAMRVAPQDAQPSKYSGDGDIRPARQWNALRLPGDIDGKPTWENLIADLVAIMNDFRPDAIVTPHLSLDPHPDHVAATEALREALSLCVARPEHILFYANHLHDNDRWPMGPAGGGVTLPPVFEAAPSSFWSLELGAETQRNKACALGMQHDLQGKLPVKKRVRRSIQRLLAGREWPRFGDNEFFRKAVRSRELFQVLPCSRFLNDHEK